MTEPDDRLAVAQGTFRLRRYPDRERSTLRAWDAADELVLHHLAEERPVPGRVAVVNDSFGALALALHTAGGSVTSVSDSLLAQRGLAANAARNHVDAPDISVQSSLAAMPTPEGGGGPIDTLVFKVPKSLAMLDDQLRRLRPALAPGATVVGAAMARHIHTSTLEIIEATLGPTATSRATKKARLIFVDPDPDLELGPAGSPSRYDHRGLTLANHAGVFSAGGVDIGTRLFLDHLPEPEGSVDVVDVGCGNGVIGLTLARGHPEASVTMIDESLRAVASATENAQLAGVTDQVRVVAADGLTELPDESVDLVVANPPFHDDHAVGDAVAWQLFNDAKRVLRPGGELRIVGNRHLGYHVKLRRVFGNDQTVASNPKFVVLRAVRS